MFKDYEFTVDEKILNRIDEVNTPEDLLLFLIDYQYFLMKCEGNYKFKNKFLDKAVELTIGIIK